MYDNNNPIDGQFSSTPKYLSNKHLIEWCEGSAVNEVIARLNIESLTDKEFNERIRPKELIKTGGWWCRGVNWRTGVFMGTWYGQGKPDKPHHPEGSKERKYLTGSGMEPDAIFLAMSDKGYWAKVHADLSIPRHWTEGVKKAGAGLSLGLPVIALTGVWNWGKDGHLAKFVEEWAQPGTTHYIDFDSDYAAKPSCRAAIIKFAQLLIEHGCTVHITCWDAQFKGMDDFIVGKGGDAFLQAATDAPAFTEWEKLSKKNKRESNVLKPNIPLLTLPRTHEDVVCLSSSSSDDGYISDTAPAGEQSYIHKAIEALYSEGHWVSIAGQLLEFTGAYYEVRPEATEKKRILEWLRTYAELVKGKYRCSRYNTASANDVYNCMVGSVAVDPNTINPLGLNCSNGVVRVNPDGSHTLVPHSPDKIYTYVGCKYDPDIDTTDCDRLLECLEPEQREIFMRTVAAALCLSLARLKMSRVKGLLCHGDGSNGKDTLRTVLVKVLGRGVTSKTLKDFQVYDTGRKFPLAGLENSLCNWSSENSDTTKLDKLQSLKQFISGDVLTIEHKGCGEYDYEPQAIFLANCNILPSISTDSKAITSRYCILSFEKIYDMNPDLSKGELQADPRFKLDPDFIADQIAPAFLKKMLERIPLILAEGINYGSGDAALREAQEKSQHLWQFVRDVGYEAGKGERVYAKDLWQELKEWYIDAGILEIEPDRNDNPKLIWNELPGRDTPVKAINQLFSRFSELFPRLEKHRHTEQSSEGERTKGEAYYLGIVRTNSEKSRNSSSPSSLPYSVGLSSSPPSSPEKSGEDVSEARSLAQRAGEDGEDVSPTLLDFCNSFSKLSASDKQKFTELLTCVPCSDPLKAFRVGDKVAGNNPEDASYNWHGRIVEIHTSINCKVDWREREGMKGGRVISMLFCNLRKI